MKKTPFALMGALCLALASCGTYQLSRQSMLEQFADSHTQNKTIVFVEPPYVFLPFHVEGNNLKTIKVLDKDGNEKVLDVTNRTGVRIIKTDSSKTSFYFNTLQIKDSTITGSKTHFFEAHFKPIRLSDVARIEIMK